MGDDDATLKGLTILVVEDTLLVAEVISDGLASYGCEIVGPVSRLDRALALAREASLDGAVLDINLAGQTSLPVAEALTRRDIPFLFITGYDTESALPPEYRRTPHLPKPFHIHSLVRLVAAHFQPKAQGADPAG
jgi:CheY-like chemotaxis protein